MNFKLIISIPFRLFISIITAVRFGRVPKREKARILAAMQQSTQNRGHQRAMATELDDQPRLLAAVLRAHMETCEFTREKVASMRQRARDCPSYSMPTMVSSSCSFYFTKSLAMICPRLIRPNCVISGPKPKHCEETRQQTRKYICQCDEKDKQVIIDQTKLRAKKKFFISHFIRDTKTKTVTINKMSGTKSNI